METQFKFVSKKYAHDLIDKMPGDKVLVLTYKEKTGMSDHGKRVKKKKGKKLVDKANVIVLAENDPVMTLNLHDKFFNDLSRYNRDDIVKSIVLVKLE